MNILSKRTVTLAEVKKVLKDKIKEYEDDEREPLYEQRRAFEHAGRAAKLGLKDSEKLMKELAGLGLNLEEDQIVKMCDLLPETVDDVRAIFAKERFKYNEDEIKKVLDVLSKYR